MLLYFDISINGNIIEERQYIIKSDLEYDEDGEDEEERQHIVNNNLVESNNFLYHNNLFY